MSHYFYRKRRVEIEALRENYKQCIETRKFEITQLVQRNNFFILFQGFLFYAVSQTKDSFLLCILPLIGVLMAFFQWRGAAGAKFWQEYWEAKLFDIEKEIGELSKGTFFPLFNEALISSSRTPDEIVIRHLKNKNCIKKEIILCKGSVSSIPIYIGIVCFYSWIFIFMYFLAKNIIPYLNFCN